MRHHTSSTSLTGALGENAHTNTVYEVPGLKGPFLYPPTSLRAAVAVSLPRRKLVDVDRLILEASISATMYGVLKGRFSE